MMGSSPIIIFEDKNDHTYFDVSTKAKDDGAYAWIFKYLKNRGDYKANPPAKNYKDTYKLACKGDKMAIKRFLWHRSNEGYEYEGLRRSMMQFVENT